MMTKRRPKATTVRAEVVALGGETITRTVEVVADTDQGAVGVVRYEGRERVVIAEPRSLMRQRTWTMTTTEPLPLDVRRMLRKP